MVFSPGPSGAWAPRWAKASGPGWSRKGQELGTGGAYKRGPTAERADSGPTMPADPDPSLHPADLTARFTAVVRRPEAEVRLDEACTLVAAHFTTGDDPDGTDLSSVRAALDTAAAEVPEPTFAAVVAHLERSGWRGDRGEYGEARGSFLPAVVRRRRGLPILLAVVAVEVSRRVGVEASVVGMPGHVLVAADAEPARLADPFHRRPLVTPDDARDLFARLHGTDARWDPGFLAPVGSHAVVTRVLANLANRYRSDNRHRQEAIALGLRSLVPGSRVSDRGALAAALARSGRFDDAAAELEELAAVGGGGVDPDALRAKATRWRARLN